MGSDWSPNQALSIKLLLEVLDWIEAKVQNSTVDVEVNRWIVAKTYLTVAYVCSLRGPEGFLLDLEGLNKHWVDGPKVKNHIYVCLRGKIKGEHGVRHHILPCVNKTKSGIDVRGTVERLI